MKMSSIVTNNLTKKNITLSEHEELFTEYFMAELESWFSADIACCDNCYEQFLEYWPLVYEANDAEFQRSSISLDCFYSGSMLSKIYSKEEYDVLKHTIHCPRCGAALYANMWAYELSFSSDIDTFEFESKIEAITKLSKTTPFLLLKNDYASKIHDLLHRLAKQIDKAPFGLPLYRARISTQIERLDFKEFTVAPKKEIKEGRYNHAGDQVLYLASDMQTCFYEVNKKLCFIAECSLNTDLKVLDLTKPDEVHETYGEELKALVFSALMSKPLNTEGWDKPVYIFSRFIADCAKSAGFDAIKYPSTKSLKNNFNLVIINENIFNDFVEFKDMFFFDGNNHVKLSIKK